MDHYFSCLLAVCTVDGHVNLYRPPVSEFCDDWVKVNTCLAKVVHIKTSGVRISSHHNSHFSVYLGLKFA